MSDTEARAREASQLLDSPLFNEAMARLEQEAIDAFIATTATQTFERDKAWVMVKQARRLRAYFEAIRDDGRFAVARAVREPLP